MTPIQVSKNVWRGPQPNTYHDLECIPNLKMVISLENDFDHCFLGAPLNEVKLPDGIIFLHRPMSDFWPVSHTRLKFLASLVAINSMFDNESIYIHCLHGVDRTGMVIAAYRMLVQKWNYKSAKAEMLAQGFHLFPYFYWLPVLRSLEK